MFYLNREVHFRKAKFVVIQPHLPWFVATPDGLISDESNKNDAIGILRIVCPRSLRNSDIEDILPDPVSLLKKTRQYLKKISSRRTSQKLSSTNGSLWSKFLWH